MRWIFCTLCSATLLLAPLVLLVDAQSPGGNQSTSTHKKQNPNPRSGVPVPINVSHPPLKTQGNTSGQGSANNKGPSGSQGSSITGTGKNATTTGKGKTDKGKPLLSKTEGKQGHTSWTFSKRTGVRGKAKMTQQDKMSIRNLVKSPAVTEPERKALEKVQNGQQLTLQERTTLSTLALQERVGVSAADREVVSRALDDDLERARVPLSRRYLYLENNTGGPLTVSVVYYTLDSQRINWIWLPEKPPAGRVLQVTLADRSVKPVRQGADPILACYARVWAKNADGHTWNEWKEKDLTLVPETNEKGQPSYLASTHDTFTFRFDKK